MLKKEMRKEIIKQKTLAEKERSNADYANEKLRDITNDIGEILNISSHRSCSQYGTMMYEEKDYKLCDIFVEIGRLKAIEQIYRDEKRYIEIQCQNDKMSAILEQEDYKLI